MDRQLGHRSPVRRRDAGVVYGVQLDQQLSRLRERRRRRRVEPGELRGLGDTSHREVERERGQVGVQNLGRRLLEQVGGLVLRPETVADSRRGSAGAPTTLIGRGSRDAYRLEPRHPRARREARRAREPAVDDDANSLDREARFGDGRGQHDLAAPVAIREERAILRVAFEHPVERRDDDAPVETLGEQRFHAADLAGAGEKGEDVALVAAQCFDDRVGDRAFDSQFPPRLDVARLDRKRTAVARHDRCVAEQPGDGLAVEGRRHDDDAQVVAQERPRAQREREAEVRVETSLVELVEHEDADAVERRVALEPSREDAFGDDLEARARARRAARRASDSRPSGPLPRRGGRPAATPRRASPLAAARASRSFGRRATARRAARAEPSSSCPRPAAPARRHSPAHRAHRGWLAGSARSGGGGARLKAGRLDS